MDQLNFQVFCNMDTDGSGWTVFQMRQDGSVDLGLSKIHHLTKEGSNTLTVDLDYVNYSKFSISDGSTKYVLTARGYSDTAGDGLIKDYTRSNHHNHSGMKSLQKILIMTRVAGIVLVTAWWFNNCQQCHLNGGYHNPAEAENWYRFIWNVWKGLAYSLSFTEIKTTHNN
ncbi:PREDICTED: fibrinogen C domain-containing protein 1-like [Amphimedon queenslandica]|uniref:Fibrinogen C-terminal domain-containing protein n=2 Tax=Amphimedon queenslandica TaxID=400682 RepID=A0AAN0J5T5_AMPQE|nr:PREDICTED: fibrinogen C domain-containing protein 1-like [Amphimedon queenslandica]XP_019852071.1 PREDICTED: fibrinogen C domain-containing protein 1-like [Amphimedon queenslandica]|eukprot:XP_011403991.1 PREDICTED: fibrinogen C domain-containing protein 1-like [Amphimedon queenslandica]